MKPVTIARFGLGLVFASVLLSALLGSAARADLPPPRLSDCDRPQQILAATQLPATAMTAIALSKDLIYWPDGNGAPLQLHASRDGNLRMDEGKRLLGADESVALLPYREPVSAALKAQFPHLLQAQTADKLFRLTGVDRDRDPAQDLQPAVALVEMTTNPVELQDRFDRTRERRVRLRVSFTPIAVTRS